MNSNALLPTKKTKLSPSKNASKPTSPSHTVNSSKNFLQNQAFSLIKFPPEFDAS
jgi:hypothetical protein